VHVDVVGAIGVTFIVISFAIKSDRKMLLTLCLGCLFYGVHFGMRDLYFPLFIQLMTVIRLIIATHKKSLFIAHIFAISYSVILAVSYSGYQDFLILISVLISTYATLIFSGVKMRKALLPASTLWLIYNLTQGIVVGVVLELTVNTSTFKN
jgi:hypothetical protein